MHPIAFWVWCWQGNWMCCCGGTVWVSMLVRLVCKIQGWGEREERKQATTASAWSMGRTGLNKKIPPLLSLTHAGPTPQHFYLFLFFIKHSFNLQKIRPTWPDTYGECRKSDPTGLMFFGEWGRLRRYVCTFFSNSFIT